MEERRRIKEADFWGRVAPAQRDLPAFWSIGAHGQPFNDERLTHGTAVHWKALSPPPLVSKEPAPAGPATECNLMLRKYASDKSQKQIQAA